jgi:hypothetical protein
MLNPYPNPNKTRVLIHGFTLPVPFPKWVRWCRQGRGRGEASKGQDGAGEGGEGYKLQSGCPDGAGKEEAALRWREEEGEGEV